MTLLRRLRIDVDMCSEQRQELRIAIVICTDVLLLGLTAFGDGFLIRMKLEDWSLGDARGGGSCRNHDYVSGGGRRDLAGPAKGAGVKG